MLIFKMTCRPLSASVRWTGAFEIRLLFSGVVVGLVYTNFHDCIHRDVSFESFQHKIEPDIDAIVRQADGSKKFNQL